MNLRPVRSVAARGCQLTDADRAWDVLYERAHATLTSRIGEYEIPVTGKMWTPLQDVAVVYRMPTEGLQKMYKGTIHIPEEYQQEETPYSIGVLLFAGPEAMGVLESHGTLPGDFVKFARFAGEEEAAQRIGDAIDRAKQRGATAEQAEEVARQVRDEEMAKKKLLELRVPFIHGSVDLTERLYGESPTMRLVREVNARGEVLHVIAPVIENLI